MSKTYSAGIVTSYGAAKRAGYTGTYEDFCRQQAQYAQNVSAIEQAKQTAVSASQSANQAKQDAQTASTTAQQSAQSAQGSAQSAGQSAQDAQTAESNAQTYAQSASQSAGSAQQSAQTAQAVFESIPEDYSDLSEDVDQLKADLAGDESKLFDMTNLLKSALSGFTENGITATLTDNVLSLNGTSTGGFTKDGMFVSPRLKPNTTYAFRILNSSGFNNGASISLRKGNDSIVVYGLAPGGTTGGTFTTPADVSDHYWRIYISNNKSFSNAIGSFMLVESDTIPTQFVPPMQPLFLSADCLVNENESLQ